MNEAKKANQDAEVFLKEVRLQNYKSIIDTQTNFRSGLNIIIGQNGSGKTNFLKFLANVLNFDFENLNSYKAEILLVDEKEHKFIIEENERDLLEVQDFKKRNNPIIKLIVLGEKEEEFTSVNDPILDIIRWRLNYKPYFLKFGIPIEQEIVDTPTSISYTFNGFRPQISTFKGESLFSFSIYFKIISQLSKKDELDIKEIEKHVLDIDEFLVNVSMLLADYTDIKKIRISPNFNLYFSNENKRIDIKNLYLEFNINSEWVPYDNLSDGTKRLFYIISEITSYDLSDIMLFNSNRENSVSERRKRIILFEEPELGIHPHQLHKLMLFIKEQSREKQIILTTHSPQVLNILDADELDRIIICNYDQHLGTQLNHLTERQIKKGQMYMQDEGFLSDYWVHSDLEPAD